MALSHLNSSPPLLPQREDNTEPPSSPPAFLPSHFELPNRKRGLPVYDDFSSDPLFSDDVVGAEDRSRYERPKQKRMLKGPWWVVNRKERRRKSRERVAFVDSGIFLGSDGGTELASDDADMLALPSSQQQVAGASAHLAALHEHNPEETACEMIARWVEQGKETIDLSGLDLTTLSSASLRPLRHLIRQSHLNTMDPPAEEAFRPLTPEIHLFLAGNRLQSLPAELFELENITTLSTRNNLLESLPASIGKLKKLRELNISANLIRVLPWELRPLIDNPEVRFTSSSNPFLGTLSWEADRVDMARDEFFQRYGSDALWTSLRPVEYIWACYWETREALRAHGSFSLRVELELRLRLALCIFSAEEGCFANPTSKMVCLATSNIRYLNIDGSPSKASKSPWGTSDFATRQAPLEKSAADVYAESKCVDTEYFVPVFQSGPVDCVERYQAGETAIPRAGACSLIEIAIQSLQKSLYPPQLESLSENAPLPVRRSLQAALYGLEFANQECSSCGRAVVIPRAEWVEWWALWPASHSSCLERQHVVPFLRKTCSWGCAIPTAWPHWDGRKTEVKNSSRQDGETFEWNRIGTHAFMQKLRAQRSSQ